MGQSSTKVFNFKRLICNLLSNVHSICINRWSHPLNITLIYMFYLNYQTIYREYKITDTNIEIKNINDVIEYAVRYDNMIIIKCCLKYKIGNNNALRIAVHYNRIKFVKMLIDKGTNTQDQLNESLRTAASIKHVDIVHYRRLANAKLYNQNYPSLLGMSKNDQLEIVKLLLLAGADIHTYDDYTLRISAAYGHLEVVKFLIDKGAKIHAQDDYALQLAAENCYLDIVKLLLDSGADKYAVNDYLLRLIAINGHLEIVKLLQNYKK